MRSLNKGTSTVTRQKLQNQETKIEDLTNELDSKDIRMSEALKGVTDVEALEADREQ